MDIFITGKPGCGKSTLINSIVDDLKKRDKRIAGIITPDIRKDNERYGFKIIDLATKKEEIMASIDIKSRFMVSKYRVSVENVNKIIDVFLESYDNADYVVIDELGKMEMCSEKFKNLINDILNNNKINIITIGLKFLKEFKDKGKIFYLKRENFDEIFNGVVELLKMY